MKIEEIEEAQKIWFLYPYLFFFKITNKATCERKNFYITHIIIQFIHDFAFKPIYKIISTRANFIRHFFFLKKII